MTNKVNNQEKFKYLSWTYFAISNSSCSICVIISSLSFSKSRTTASSFSCKYPVVTDPVSLRYHHLDILELLGLGLGLLAPSLGHTDLGVQLVQHALLSSAKLCFETSSQHVYRDKTRQNSCINVVIRYTRKVHVTNINIR